MAELLTPVYHGEPEVRAPRESGVSHLTVARDLARHMVSLPKLKRRERS